MMDGETIDGDGWGEMMDGEMDHVSWIMDGEMDGGRVGHLLRLALRLVLGADLVGALARGLRLLCLYEGPRCHSSPPHPCSYGKSPLVIFRI